MNIKEVLNLTLVCIILSDNNMSKEQIENNLEILEKFENDFNNKDWTNELTDDDIIFYRNKIKNAYNILNNDLKEL